ncbi:MAG: hypothetical protein V4608_16910 [Bacteroidota bacterium]
MITRNLQLFRKIETILLSIMLYGIFLVYIFQYFQIAGKYQPWTTDEFFYYIEAKGIASQNIYQTPASLDGNTSYIGNFGFHGISYAIKDGWLSKLFFHTNDPPMVWINVLTCFVLLLLILLFKPLELNTRLKIALVVATHYILYTFTFSYMQETIQFLFGVLALRILYLIYSKSADPNSINVKIIYYLIIVVIAIAFRFSWFIWGLGLLPLTTNLKSFIKWSLIAIGLLLLGLFFNHYISAPYPYDGVIMEKLIGSEKSSLINSLHSIWGNFTNNLELFLTPTILLVTSMRYLFLILLLLNTSFAIIKRNKFAMACSLIAWAYFIACLCFSFAFWGYDERALAVISPLLAFSLIGTVNSFIFYPIIILQLYFLPSTIEQTNIRNNTAIAVNTTTPERTSREASYSQIKDLITDEENIVVELPIRFVVHAAPTYFINLPLVTAKGYPIHYRIYREGKDKTGARIPHYLLNTNDPFPIPDNNQLIYSNKWMSLYRLF